MEHLIKILENNNEALKLLWETVAIDSAKELCVIQIMQNESTIKTLKSELV